VTGTGPTPRSRVRAALARVPAAAFPEALEPELAARVLEALELQGGERVLLVAPRGTWTAALLCELAGVVHVLLPGTEQVAGFRADLENRGYQNFSVRAGDPGAGRLESLPYDAVLVEAAVPGWPPRLLDQLAPGGLLAAPLGPPGRQSLRILCSAGGGRPARVRDLGPVSLPPLPPPAGD